MTVRVVVAVVTALLAVVVVVTRARSLAADAAGTTSRWVGGLHTLAGAIGLAGWTGYLLTGQLEVGILSLFLLWLAALAGLVMLPRLLAGTGDRTRGGRLGRPAVLLAHLGAPAAVAYFTWAYLVAAV